MPRYVWGVDSAASVTDELFSCVRKNYGNPKYWGRYLTKVPNVVWVWKYGRDAPECPIDTNLCDSRVISYLF